MFKQREREREGGESGREGERSSYGTRRKSQGSNSGGVSHSVAKQARRLRRLRLRRLRRSLVRVNGGGGVKERKQVLKWSALGSGDA